jgi:hypothetical protein
MLNAVSKQLLEAHRQDPVAVAVDVGVHGAMLQGEHQRGVDADDFPGAGAEHAPAEVAVAAAHVEHAAAGERRHVRCDPRPLPVGPPLRVDVDAEQRERPLAPWVQLPQRRREPCTLRRGGGAVDANRVAELDAVGHEGRQRGEGGEPARHVAVGVGLESSRDQRFEGRQVVGQRRFADHGQGRASNEAQLRH